MELKLTHEEKQFRQEVQDFLNEKLTPELRHAGRLMTSVFADQPSAMAWQKILHEKGWAAPHWPVEYGGTNWSVIQHYIFQEECAKADAPSLLPMSLSMCAPCLIGKGTEEQKAYYLPRILTGEDFWCQGYSEPQAGSDLAALQCKAERDGDHYVLNGSKIWTTYAHYANKMFALVRTDASGKPQQGITFLLLDMDADGITVDPIHSVTREHEQNAVFFDNVRVPVTNVVGKENEGWAVAKYLLEFERGGTAYAPSLRVALKKIRHLAESNGRPGQRPIDRESFQLKLARAEVDIQAIQAVEFQTMAALNQGKSPGPASSMLKICGTELSQQLTELAMEALGPYTVAFQPDALDPHSQNPTIVGPEAGVPVASKYFNTRAASIYAGSNEIQRNIIARAVLGL